mgnify:CR=1 FL=1
MKVCRMHRAKISLRIQTEESKPTPKGYTHIDFSVEKHPTKESAHITEFIRGIYAEANA